MSSCTMQKDMRPPVYRSTKAVMIYSLLYIISIQILEIHAMHSIHIIHMVLVRLYTLYYFCQAEYSQMWNLFNRSAFDTTETELIAIAAPANIGLKSGPPKAYRIPAAIGMPARL